MALEETKTKTKQNSLKFHY